MVDVARHIGIDGYQEESYDKNGDYSDAYLYPTVGHLPDLLDILRNQSVATFLSRGQVFHCVNIRAR